jgi:hypothetical protein
LELLKQIGSVQQDVNLSFMECSNANPPADASTIVRLIVRLDRRPFTQASSFLSALFQKNLIALFERSS